MDNEVKDDRPDSEKTNEELQREILLAQKRKLEEEETRKRKRDAMKTPAIIVVILAVIIGFFIYNAWKDNKEREERVERIKDALLSESMPQSDEFLETLPMVN